MTQTLHDVQLVGSGRKVNDNVIVLVRAAPRGQCERFVIERLEWAVLTSPERDADDLLQRHAEEQLGDCLA